jgi:hypothetical protein
LRAAHYASCIEAIPRRLRLTILRALDNIKPSASTMEESGYPDALNTVARPEGDTWQNTAWIRGAKIHVSYMETQAFNISRPSERCPCDTHICNLFSDVGLLLYDKDMSISMNDYQIINLCIYKQGRISDLAFTICSKLHAKGVQCGSSKFIINNLSPKNINQKERQSIRKKVKHDGFSLCYPVSSSW